MKTPRTHSATSVTALITSIGRRTYLAEYFRDALHGYGSVIGVDADATAPALAACSRAFTVPRITDEGYIDAIVALIAREHADMVFSVNDLELRLLADHRTEIESVTGATLYVPEPESARICADKWATYEYANAVGVPTPRTYLSVEDALDAVAQVEVRFPLIVKPRFGSGSVGIARVDEARDLASAVDRCRAAIATYAGGALDSLSQVLVQEFLPGQEFGIDALFSRGQELMGFAAKRKLSMRAGETDKATVVSPEPFREHIARLTSRIDHRGNLDCDFIVYEGRAHLIEMNPRFGGGYPFTHEAGVNHVAMLVGDFLGAPPKPYGYVPGATFAKCDRIVPVTSPVAWQ